MRSDLTKEVLVKHLGRNVLEKEKPPFRDIVSAVADFLLLAKEVKTWEGYCNEFVNPDNVGDPDWEDLLRSPPEFVKKMMDSGMRIFAIPVRNEFDDRAKGYRGYAELTLWLFSFPVDEDDFIMDSIYRFGRDSIYDHLDPSETSI